MAVYEYSCVDDAKEGLLQHELETNSRYSVYRTSRFGNASLNTAKKVFWEDQGSVKFGRQEFSGIPFVVLGQKIYDCHCGKNRKEKRKARNKEKKTEEDLRCTKRKKVSLQDTKKMNCPARCVFRDICRFPSFQIQPDNTSTPFERQQIAKDILARLAAGDDILSERVIIAHFPSIEQHTCHTLEEIPPEPIDPRLSKKIVEYVQSGVTKLHTMRTLLNNYVMDICGPHPHPTSKRFYPSDQCICQHMYRAKKGDRKRDQEIVFDMDGSNSNEMIASQTRVTLNARTVWVGTFRGTPVAPIHLSEDGLNFFIKGDTGTHTFHLYPQEIQQCLFKFHGEPNLIFFLTTESYAIRTRKDLGMDVNAALETPQLDHDYDPSWTDMQHQMITIVMEQLPVGHRLDFQKNVELFKSWGKQGDENFFMDLSKEEGDEIFRQSTGVQIVQAVSPASPNIGFVGPINANEELQAARWTCFVCHKRVDNSSISSLETQERAGKSKLFVDSSYSIILRCQKCMLAFHALCVKYDLEPIITGREDRVYCDHCANPV